MSAFIPVPKPKNTYHEKLVFVFDKHGKFTYVNDDFCQLCGHERDNILGKDYDFLRHEDMPTLIYDELWQWLNKGYSWQGLIKNKNSDGMSYWLDTFVTPQYNEGRIIGFQCVCRVSNADLSERAEKVYQALNKNSKWVLFEFSRRHKFILLIIITLIAQGIIFIKGGLLASIITALSAMTPIAIFWQDIVPMAQRAQKMQSTFDSISRYILWGKGTASVFDFNLGMLKAKIKAILERTSDSTIPLTRIVRRVQEGMEASRYNIELQNQEMMQINVAINQMSTASLEIAQNTVTAAEEVNVTQEQCKQARGDIEQTAKHIRTLAKEVGEAAASADNLSQEARNIEGLMTDIQSIADQTNLLALNAAIEAARAGENGRGFAVVAEEVRNLSFRTQESSKQIQTSLMAMLETINNWAVLMEQNKDNANACVNAAEQSDQAIDTVYQKVEQIANLVTQIATAAEEQEVVTRDVSNNMLEINQASKQNWQQTEAVIEHMTMLHQRVEDIANLSNTFMPKPSSS